MPLNVNRPLSPTQVALRTQPSASGSLRTEANAKLAELRAADRLLTAALSKEPQDKKELKSLLAEHGPNASASVRAEVARLVLGGGGSGWLSKAKLPL